MSYTKRKRFIVNKKLQLGIFLKWIIIPVVALSAALYYFRGNAYVLIMAITAVLLFSWHILILSHRLAGPVYRLEKDLEDIAKGNFSIRIKFRKKDELKSIADGINRILDEMEKKITNRQGGLNDS
ncbi:MAG: methyl-accepting chemotaxis protein [Candidatus Omnitrophica bacterium]|nr:methyl-accepting chemotaxis protein [Candidatus Omnitrophota bacterium]MBU1932496.1 methyl-accepting chemotaxis protein [Candidatus Omnitrophota bacterium]